MDSRYGFLTLGIPWTQSMPSCDVNAATRLAEASWSRDNISWTSFVFKALDVIWHKKDVVFFSDFSQNYFCFIY